MQYIKHLILSALALNMLSCGFLEDKTKDFNKNKATKSQPEVQKNMNDYIDSYDIIPNMTHPKLKLLSSAFKKQEHRFEIDRCAFKYNGKSFFIGDTMEKIKSIFGAPDSPHVPTQNIKTVRIQYKELKILFKFSESDKKLKAFKISFTNQYDGLLPKFNIILFHNVPYALSMTLNEFMELSNLDHNKLRHNIAAFYIRQKKCFPTNSEYTIYTSLDSEPIYNSVGGGHITMRGDFKPESSKLIESIYIKKEKLK